MTPSNTTGKTSQVQGRFWLPDPPQREPDEMTGYDQVHKTGSSHHLAHHFGNPETTLVEADRWIDPYPRYGWPGGVGPTCSSPLTWTRRPTPPATGTSSQSRRSPGLRVEGGL